MKYLSTLQIRTVDSHTVFLGINEQWSRLSLPWISRDIGLLIGQLDEPSMLHDDPLERLTALKICLTQLSAVSDNLTLDAPIKIGKEAKEFYEDAKVIPLRMLHHHKEENELIVTASISELLINEQSIQRHVGLISLVIYSDQAVMLGPILAGKAYCLFCYRHLLAIPFGLRKMYKKREEENFLDMGLKLGQMVEREDTETLFFDGKSIEIEPFVPFIGCPICLKGKA